MPAMVAAGLLLTVGHGQLQKAFNTMPEAIVEPSFNMLEAPEAIADHKQDQELEAFLEESWSYSFGEHLYREDRLAGEKVNFVVNTNP
ncbi:hypothetical protein FLX56_21565 [Synechococcus moorigangaii CMS01]|nr:hypothetical protein [Synechococcus moorigangaii CMS01]